MALNPLAYSKDSKVAFSLSSLVLILSLPMSFIEFLYAAALRDVTFGNSHYMMN